MLGKVKCGQKNRIQKLSYCLFLTVVCFILPQIFLNASIYADQSMPAATLPALPQTALPQPELSQPSPSVEEAPDSNDISHLPLVLAQSLEKLTLAEIKFYYPGGIQIVSASMPMTLKKKLTVLERRGYKVLYLHQSNRELQLLTGEVISHYEKKELDRFLENAYRVMPEMRDQDTSAIWSCPVFLKKIFIPYIVWGKASATKKEALKDLSKFSPVVYRHFLHNHPFWNNLGFASMEETPGSLRLWLSDAAGYSQGINQKMLKVCGALLTDKSLFYISEIIALDYLKDSVSKAYYNHHSHRNTANSQRVAQFNQTP